MNDPGDEDDAAACPKRGIRIALAGWRFREGPVRCYYPAERIPSDPDHDPGDEQPRMRISSRFLEALEASL